MEFALNFSGFICYACRPLAQYGSGPQLQKLKKLIDKI